MREINDWIEKNKENVGNANMYEIMSCMVARNNIRIIEGENPELDDEVERMISLRSKSIEEFQTDVPESKPLFDAVRDGLTGESREEMELICKCQSVPYDIEKELRNSEDNIELDSYSEELRSGKYRDMEKLYNTFSSRGINKEDI